MFNIEWFNSGWGQVILAFIIGGGCISYMSFFYDFIINKRGKKQDENLNRLLENELDQTEKMNQTLRHLEVMLTTSELIPSQSQPQSDLPPTFELLPDQDDTSLETLAYPSEIDTEVTERLG